MCSAYMQGAMNSAISAEESTKLDDSKSILLYLTPTLVLELWASKVGQYLEISPKWPEFNHV